MNVCVCVCICVRVYIYRTIYIRKDIALVYLLYKGHSLYREYF
jgi:hypothetical protein